MTRDRVLDGLFDLLERERRALCKGDVAAAARLGPAKEKLLGRLTPERSAQNRITKLRAVARHNEELLSACRAGIEAARARIAALRNPKPDTTYSASGERQEIRSPSGTLSRRA